VTGLLLRDQCRTQVGRRSSSLPREVDAFLSWSSFGAPSEPLVRVVELHLNGSPSGALLLFAAASRSRLSADDILPRGACAFALTLSKQATPTSLPCDKGAASSGTVCDMELSRMTPNAKLQEEQIKCLRFSAEARRLLFFLRPAAGSPRTVTASQPPVDES
jgi:hypothetical protein